MVGAREAHDCSPQIDRNTLLVGRLAHDFGNYLTGVLGFAELALGQTQPNTAGHRYLKEVCESAKRGAAWVHRLQVIGRRGALSQIPSSVSMAVEEAVSPVKGGGIVLETRLPDTLPLVTADPSALREALAELLANAREAIGDRGKIQVAAEVNEVDATEAAAWLGDMRPGRYVEIRIEDDGRGLPADVADRLVNDVIFAEKPRQRGLGLAMVYGIARAGKGGLRFGPHPARGSLVRLAFPIVPSENHSSVPARSSVSK